MGVPCAGTLLGSCCPLRFQSVCGGTHARDASLRADCRSGEDGFIEGPTPFGRRLRQKAPRDRVPSSAHAVRFASRAPVGVPAPGSLRSVSGVALVRAASLEGVCPMEDDFSRFSPPASREAKGAEVSADESITACGCEEVDAAVPRLRLTQDHIPSRSTTCPRSIAHHNRTNPEALSSAARSSHHSPGYTNPHCRRTSVSTDITSRLSVSCRTSSSGIGVSTPASRSDGGTPSPSPWRASR